MTAFDETCANIAKLRHPLHPAETVRRVRIRGIAPYIMNLDAIVDARNAELAKRVSAKRNWGAYTGGNATLMLLNEQRLQARWQRRYGMRHMQEAAE